MSRKDPESIIYPMSWEETVALIIIIPIIFIIGIAGNIVVIVTYVRIKKKLAAHVLTIALAVVDLLAIVTTFPLAPPHAYGVLPTQMSYFVIRMHCATITFSLTILFAVSIDRYYAVYKPISYNSPRRNKIFIKSTGFIAIGLTVLIEVFYLFRNFQAVTIYILSLYIALTLLGMLVVYILIFKKLHLQQRQLSPATVPSVSDSTLQTTNMESVLQHRRPEIQPVSKEKNSPMKHPGSARTQADLKVNAKEMKQLNLKQSGNNLEKGCHVTPGTSKTSLRVNNWVYSSASVPLCVIKSSVGADSIQQVSVKHATHGTHANSLKDKKRKHIKVMAKVFCLITTLFVISYTPTVISLAVNRRATIITYTHYLNNICNPIVYWIMNTDFRKQVKQLLPSRFFRQT